MKSIAVIFTALIFTGCSSTSSLINKITGKNHESAQVYITGTVDALSLVTNRTQEIELASSLAGSAQEIEGLPPSGKRLNVKALLNQEKDEIQILEDRRNNDSRNAVKLREAEARLLELGSQKESENRQSIIGRIKSLVLYVLPVILVIAGLIAACFICPPLIPVIGSLLGMLGRLLAWIVSKIPGMVHTAGVVGASAFENIVKGVGQVREELKADPKKLYTADEVLKLVDDQLKFATDNSDRAIIEKIREKIKV